MTDDSTPEHVHTGDAVANIEDALSIETAGAVPVSAAPAAASGYVLTRRDRTAVKLIDWAVNFGTPEFRAIYRPVSDELFTHHFIDSTAKPAFVPPAIVSVEQLDAASDPLEVIRSHLGLVIDDRQARDKARLDAQTHYEEASQTLAELQVRASGLETDLADTTERLRVADAEIATLTERLAAEVSGLHTTYTTQIDELQSKLATDTEAQRAAHEAEIERLSTEHADAVALLTSEREAETARLTGEHQAETARLAAERDDSVGGLTTGHAAAIAELESQHEAERAAAESRHTESVDALRTQHDEHAAAAALELAAAVAATGAITGQLKDARLEAAALTAQRDRAIAEGSEWRSRLQQVVAGLASTADVGEWSETNAPDARLVDFIEETQLELTTRLELAQATLDEIEDVATAQLVDETETSDYAIGANDAAVLILNSLWGTDDEEAADAAAEADLAAELGSDAETAPRASADEPTLGASSATNDDESAANGVAVGDSAAADEEFAEALSDDVDVEIDFDEFAADSKAPRAS
ncbi:hypothetical protein [Subtercola lobariae]|uniref:Uncharacterized protein n=1 Tax=Subtercola lobariae TaxID=1588641 RepID=A0A917BDP6_9MICO|nr:hypothetical protein [Subtercola lobariae]GGF33638.1 hypothetical protein GCM10011399_28480 [Subtercola lobariae]